MAKTRIGVLTSGGDCPGLNAVLRGVTRAADNLQWEVVGFRDGFEGLLPPGDYMILDRANTAGIMPRGGTILGTTNKGHFVAKAGAGDRMEIPAHVLEKTKEMFHALDLKALIAIGGDGSLTTALQMYDAGLPVIGVPKTIDNDIEATAMTFGFDSAVACVADALDRLHTTATSHKRVMVLEVMGRNAGWIALYGGLAGGADVILIPEIAFDMDKVAEVVKQRDREGCKTTMVVVAEGAHGKEGQQFGTKIHDGEYKLAGIADWVGAEIGERTGKDVRTCVLGHLQRGGVPTTLDRILGTRFGVKAVKLIEEEKFGYMVSYQNYQTLAVPISEAVHRLRTVQPDSQIVETARAVEISFGD